MEDRIEGMPQVKDLSEGGHVIERMTYSVEECAKALGLGRTLAYEAIRRGDIPAIRIGRKRLLVPKAALAKLLEDTAQGIGPPL